MKIKNSLLMNHTNIDNILKVYILVKFQKLFQIHFLLFHLILFLLFFISTKLFLISFKFIFLLTPIFILNNAIKLSSPLNIFIY